MFFSECCMFSVLSLSPIYGSSPRLTELLDKEDALAELSIHDLSHLSFCLRTCDSKTSPSEQDAERKSYISERFLLYIF